MTLLRNWIFKILYISGIGNFMLNRNRKRGKVPVLVFHKIIPEHEEVWPGLHPHLFEKILILLKRHYNILPLSHLHTSDGTDLKNACFITFDDGYKDYLEYAYPILKKHKVHSTLFVLPYDLSNHGHIWTATILYFVKEYSVAEIKEFFTSQNQKIDFKNASSLFILNLTITKHLCQLSQKERDPIIKAALDKFEADNKTMERELLCMNELKKLDSSLVDIASHSLTHPSFKLETDKKFIEYELKESKKVLEAELKVSVDAFAFPFAKYNELSLGIVKENYKMCFTGINDFVDLDKLKNDKKYLYGLSRFNVHQSTAEEAFFLINGFHKMRKI